MRLHEIMWWSMLAALAMLLVFAARVPAAPVLCTDDGGRMVAWTDARGWGDSLPPRFMWEIGAATVQVSRDAESSRIEWRLDPAGPGWIYLRIEQFDYELILTAESDQEPCQTEEHLGGWVDFLCDSSGAAWLARSLLQRMGVNPHLPRQSTLRSILAQESPTLSASEAQRLASILAQLDADDWHVRMGAVAALERWPYIGAIPRRGLSVEQVTRIECIVAKYEGMIAEAK